MISLDLTEIRVSPEPISRSQRTINDSYSSCQRCKASKADSANCSATSASSISTCSWISLVSSPSQMGALHVCDYGRSYRHIRA